MVLFFENLGKKDLAVKVLVQAFFGSLFVQLKGNDKVWTQITGEFTGYYYRVAAKRQLEAPVLSSATISPPQDWHT